jgi:hypothetical protein
VKFFKNTVPFAIATVQALSALCRSSVSGARQKHLAVPSTNRFLDVNSIFRQFFQALPDALLSTSNIE